METKKICTILTAEDLKKEKIKTTVKTMEHNPNKFYLLDANWKTDLCYVIEELSEESDDTTLLTKTRIAYDLNFPIQTVLKIGNSMSAQEEEVRSLSELLELLDFNENLILNREDYHVVVDDDGIEASDGNDEASCTVAKIFQQVIFLNLNLDVQKKSEIKKSLIKERFRKNYPELLKEVKDNKNFIESTVANAKLNPESKERAEKIVKSFDIMLAEFEKAKSRPIRIAAMGCKKCGKSVVINSLLKRDYAPTSAELPTPNTIKYIPAEPDSSIILEYNGNEYTFHKAKEIKEFIGNEFKRAQKITGEGAGLQDMTIYYPCDDLNGYEIWDTPGPNVAFTDEHKKNAEACIKEVDVCIFIINYSNHLATDEVEYLKKIYSAFKENNKFYSLFFDVNRIDERYSTTVEKSVNRFIDYVRGRLEKLQYENTIIFGTSALQSFYLDNVINLVKADRKSDGEDENELPLVYMDSIRPLKRRHKDEVTQIKFVGDALGNLEDFHGITEPTEKELYALSGVPQLLKYTRYIGESKADMEIVNSVIGKCETEFATVNNALLVTDLLKLTEQDRQRLRELSELIRGLSREVDKAVDKVRPLMNEDKLHSAFYNVSEVVKTQRRSANEAAINRSRLILDEIGFTSSDVEQMSKGSQPYNITKMNEAIGKMILGFNKQSLQRLETAKEAISDKHISGVEAGIQNAQTTIFQKTEEVKAKVTNSTAQNILESFKVPEFPSSLDRMQAEFENADFNIDNSSLHRNAQNAHRVEYETKTKTEYREKTRTKYRTERRAKKRSGFFGWVADIFSTKYEDVEVPYQETFKEPYEVSYQVSHDVYNVEKFKDSIAWELQGRMSKIIDDTHDKMESAVKEDIENIFDDVKDQCEEISNSYLKLFEDFEKDINMASDETDTHRKALERDIETLSQIKNKLQPFFKMWNDILYSEAKG